MCEFHCSVCWTRPKAAAVKHSLNRANGLPAVARLIRSRVRLPQAESRQGFAVELPGRLEVFGPLELSQPRPALRPMWPSTAMGKPRFVKVCWNLRTVFASMNRLSAANAADALAAVMAAIE